MLHGAEKIQPGALIFVTARDGLISALIRWQLGFRYSHVAYYMGVGKILEADFGGVQINDISRYLDNPDYAGEVIANPLSADRVQVMANAMLSHLEARYDYSLLLGHALTHITLRCNKNPLLRLFDQAKGWICSELIAEGLRQAGVVLPKEPAAMTPKDIHNLLTKELPHG